MVWLGGNLLADVLIASFMLYTLQKAQSQSLSKGARAIIYQLMVNTVDTGVITTLVVGAEMVLWLIHAGGIRLDYYETIIFILGPLYPNVCLANLNARARTRKLGDNVQFSTARMGAPNSGRANTTLRFMVPSTNVTRSGANSGHGIEAVTGLVRGGRHPV
ncbi:hypothetical protein BD779DRAFT_342973 [Infundibulicybe gibba]|nr:hypothetical protein BD779DRAFT_342973 [Infundibulicybe gibba]